MLTRLMILILALAGTLSHGAGLEGTEAKMVHVLSKLQEPGAADPTFRCFHIGRLQATSELLTGNLSRLETRTNRTETDNQLLQRAKQLKAGMAKILSQQNSSCSYGFKEEAGGIPEANLIKEISALKRKLNGIGAEDPIPKCFHLGRLSIWTGGLKRMISKKVGKGDTIAPKTLRFLENAYELVDREFARSCKPAPRPKGKSIDA